MYVGDIEVNAPDGEFYIVQCPDMHADLKAFNLKKFMLWRDEVIRLTKTHKVIVICQGDYVHGRLPGDKFFNAEILRGSVVEHLNNYVGFMTEYVGDLLLPLTEAGADLWLLDGNHDNYVQFASIPGLIAKYVNGIYVGNEMLLRVRAVDQYGKTRVKVIYAGHGAGAGGRPGAKINKVMDAVHIADADAYLYGHLHDAVSYTADVPYIPRQGRAQLAVRQRLYAYGSSFVDGRTEGVFDYAGAKALRSTNPAMYSFLVDTWEDRFFLSQLRC